MKRLYQLGLTGGIGSGKSTAAQMLVQLGATLIDADAISRSLTAPGGAAIEPIRLKFGNSAIDSTGAMDRAKIRQLVFENAAAKAQLETIIHPLVREAGALAVAQCKTHWIVHDIPLLVESGRSRASFDSILVIDCLESTQISRVQARSGMPEADVLRVLSNQASRAQRLSVADHVVFNDGIGLTQLQTTLQALVSALGLQAQTV